MVGIASSIASKSWIQSSLIEASAALAKGLVTSEKLTHDCIQQSIKKRNCNIFITEDFDNAILKAQESDQRRKNGLTLSPIDGIPVAFKDLFCTNGLRTTAASLVLKDFIPPYESTATQRLVEAGAISLGKLNLDEFAMGSANIFSAFGPTVNPWSTDILGNPITPGGSSGGSAAAVASGCCFAALGSDTGGSVRLPAAYCGVVGLKPRYGRVSRYGMISFASSLDTPGLFTRSVRDAALIMNIIAGPDSKDSTCLQEELPKDWCLSENENNLKDLKVGVPQEYLVKELPSGILDVWDQGIRMIESLGATIVPVSLPSTKYALPAYYVIASAEASSNLSRYDGVRYGTRSSFSKEDLEEVLNSKEGDADAFHKSYKQTRSKGFGPEVQRRILSGCFVLSAGAFSDYYEKAVATRMQVKQEFNTMFQSGVDVIVTPTTPTPPYGINDLPSPTSMYLNDIMTIPASLAGLPAISIPISVTKETNLPLGLQLIGLKEEKVIQAAKAIEEQTNFASIVPSYVY